MGSTDLDSLLEAGASATAAHIDNIMSLIRAHVHGNGNGNGSAPTPPSLPAKPQPRTVGEALLAQAQFNHELIGTLRALGERFLGFQNELAQVQGQQRAAAEQTRGVLESLTALQSKSSAVKQELAELERGLTGLSQDLTGELESGRRQRYEQIRQLAQLEERIRQIDTVLLVTGRRVDGVASRAYNTEQTLDGVREHMENESAGMGKLNAEVAKIDARALELAQQLGRMSAEMTQYWGEELANRDKSYREMFAGLQTGLDSVAAWFNQELVTAQERLQSELKGMQELVSAQAKSSEAVTGQIRTDLSRIGPLEQKVEALSVEGINVKEQYDHRFDELTMRLLRAERATADGTSQPCEGSSPIPDPALLSGAKLAQPSQGSAPRNTNPPMDYFMFSLQHRGSVDSVRARQAAYLDLFHGRKQVLDLGCGRGEFLELFSGNGTHAVGVDANKDMIDFCREHGLEAIQADLFEYLQSVPDTSVDGIFSAQVIEHLSPNDIRMLIHLCSQKLTPDGLLVLETVNPLCPFALTNFWLDPTHVRPVLPKLLTFMLEEAGFTIKALRFNSPIEGSSAAPSVETVNEWPSVLDQYQDYAAIASSRQKTVEDGN